MPLSWLKAKRQKKTLDSTQIQIRAICEYLLEKDFSTETCFSTHTQKLFTILFLHTWARYLYFPKKRKNSREKKKKIIGDIETNEGKDNPLKKFQPRAEKLSVSRACGTQNVFPNNSAFYWGQFEYIFSNSHTDRLNRKFLCAKKYFTSPSKAPKKKSTQKSDQTEKNV